MASCDFTNTLSSGGICYTMEPRSEMKNCYTYKTIGYPSKRNMDHWYIKATTVR